METLCILLTATIAGSLLRELLSLINPLLSRDSNAYNSVVHTPIYVTGNGLNMSFVGSLLRGLL